MGLDRSWVIGLVVGASGTVGCADARDAADDGGALGSASGDASDGTTENETEQSCELPEDPSTSGSTVRLFLENATAEPVFVNGSLGYGCPGYLLEPIGGGDGSTLAQGDLSCFDVGLGSCGVNGHPWCPGERHFRIEPGERYEITWDGWLFREIDVPQCFGCEALSCAAEFAAPAGGYRVRFDTYAALANCGEDCECKANAEDQYSGDACPVQAGNVDLEPTGSVEIEFDHPDGTEVVLRVE